MSSELRLTLVLTMFQFVTNLRNPLWEERRKWRGWKRVYHIGTSKHEHPVDKPQVIISALSGLNTAAKGLNSAQR